MTSAMALYNETEECPYIAGQEDFSVRRHLGEWFVHEYLDAPFLRGLSCVYFDFVYQHVGAFLVKIVGLRDVTGDFFCLWRNEEILMTYTCFFNETDRAIMTILHTNESALEYLPTYVVVDTDYTDYSVLYSCFQPLYPDNKLEFLWILSRKGKTVPAKKIQEVKARLKISGVNTDALIRGYNHTCRKYANRWFWY
ncbi:hypothetical protein BsWGS_12857 [Bradybaena similaris]